MRQSRTATLADALLGLILDGTFSPGDALPSEADLADRFEVSRLTVREAIRTLASTRVIEVRQGRSSTINPADRWSPLDPRLLEARGRITGQPLLLPRKLIEARSSIESGVAELAAGRRTDEHIEHLYLHLEAMRHAHQQGDLTRFVEADLAFHGTLFKAVDNVFLEAVFEPLVQVLRTLRTATSSLGEIQQNAIDWHTRILAAVAEGDAQKSREAMWGHIMQTEEDSEQYLTSESRVVGPSTIDPDVT